MPIGHDRGFSRSPIERSSIRHPLDVRLQNVGATRNTFVLNQVTDSFDAFAGKRQLQRLILHRRFASLQG
jgi:hypothetical protein